MSNRKLHHLILFLLVASLAPMLGNAAASPRAEETPAIEISAEGLSPAALALEGGHSFVFVNATKGPARILFDSRDLKRISCRTSGGATQSRSGQFVLAGADATLTCDIRGRRLRYSVMHPGKGGAIVKTKGRVRAWR